jgi:hypothetical protein
MPQQHRHTNQLRQNASHFVLGQQPWNALGLLRSHHVVEPRHINAQHLAVHQQHSTECLVVRRGRHLSIIGQHGQKGFHIGHAHATPVAHAAGLCGTPANEKTNPVEASLLGFEAILLAPNPLANLIKQPGAAKKERRVLSPILGICTAVIFW